METRPNTQRLKIPGSLLLLFRLSYAVVFVAFPFIAGSILAVATFTWLSENHGGLLPGGQAQWSSIGLSIALVVASAKQFLLSARKICRYVLGFEASDLYSDGVHLGFVFFGLCLAFLVALRPPVDRAEPILPRVAYAVPHRAQPEDPVALPAFKFPRAKWNWDEGRFDRGTSITTSSDHLVHFLEQLGTSCGAVTLRAQGFASSSPFLKNGRPAPDSNELNVHAANARAESLTSVLRSAASKIGPSKLVVLDPVPWNTIAEMKESRDSLFTGSEAMDPEDSHRIAVIRVENAEQCDVVYDGLVRFGTALAQRASVP
jgi:hypothetical protein